MERAAMETKQGESEPSATTFDGAHLYEVQVDSEPGETRPYRQPPEALLVIAESPMAALEAVQEKWPAWSVQSLRYACEGSQVVDGRAQNAEAVS